MTGSVRPFDRFLATADVATWAECLDEGTQAAGSTADDGQRATALADALCMAIYLEWLARISGDLTTAARTSEVFDGLRERVVEVGEPTAPAWRRCWVLLLVHGGYLSSAAELLGDTAAAPVELAVLLVRSDDVSALVALRPLVRGVSPTRFLPAVFTYLRRGRRRRSS
jgi:hypothetical protein